MSSSIQTRNAPTTTTMAAEEDDEGGDRRLARRSTGQSGRHRGHEVAGVETGALGHGGRQLVGDSQPHLDQLDGNGGEKHGQWHVDEHGPQEHRKVLSVDRLDHTEEQHGQYDDAAQRGHGLVVLGEPRGPEVDRGGGGQHRSNLVEQPHRTLGHPAAQGAEHAVHAETGDL